MEFMSQVLDQLLLQYMLAIFGIGKELKDVRDEVVKHFDYLETWFKTYYKQPLSKKNLIDETSEKNRSCLLWKKLWILKKKSDHQYLASKGKLMQL